MYRLRAATVADVDFLTDVVIEATRHQGRLPLPRPATRPSSDSGSASGVARRVPTLMKKDNPRARALHGRLGFAVVGETDQDYVMRCSASAST